MSFYIASSREIPLIPYSTDKPEFYTETVPDHQSDLKELFSFSHIASFGSDQGCGCGFRHSLFEDKQWIDVVEPDMSQTDNNNHLQLVNFIRQANSDQNSMEILVCWNEDYHTIRHRETIQLSDILNPDFHFKEDALYKVTLSS